MGELFDSGIRLILEAADEAHKRALALGAEGAWIMIVPRSSGEIEIKGYDAPWDLLQNLGGEIRLSDGRNLVIPGPWYRQDPEGWQKRATQFAEAIRSLEAAHNLKWVAEKELALQGLRGRRWMRRRNDSHWDPARRVRVPNVGYPYHPDFDRAHGINMGLLESGAYPESLPAWEADYAEAPEEAYRLVPDGTGLTFYELMGFESDGQAWKALHPEQVARFETRTCAGCDREFQGLPKWQVCSQKCASTAYWRKK